MAQNVFVETFSGSGSVCTMVSEESEQPRHFKAQCARNSYAVLYDPLDGSSNSDVNGALGTIFAIRRRQLDHGHGIEDLLTPGTEQIASGYALYGRATMLVWTTGQGVNVFVLEPAIGEFVLWREKIRMPERGKSYAANQANAARWHPGACARLDRFTGPKDKGGGYSLRYCGAFVGDFHRCLLKVGKFLHPGETRWHSPSDSRLRAESLGEALEHDRTLQRRNAYYPAGWLPGSRSICPDPARWSFIPPMGLLETGT